MRRLVGFVLGLGIVVLVAWVALWWWGAEDWPVSFPVLALTPPAVLGGLVVAALGLLARRWALGALALLAVLVLAVPVVMRGVADDAPSTTGQPLTVATANLQFGRADAGALVELVRAGRIDVLGLQELTPAVQERLVAAGLYDVLPYRAGVPRDGAGGTGIASRYPLAPVDLGLRPAQFAQVAVRIDVEGIPVDAVVVHPAAPVFRDPAGWAREIRELPGPVELDGPARVLMGDFNATLDHRPLRDLVDTGHSDAADAVGDGFVATWPTDRALPPFAAIDHVLISGPVNPMAIDTHRLAGTDHAVLTGDLRLLR